MALSVAKVESAGNGISADGNARDQGAKVDHDLKRRCFSATWRGALWIVVVLFGLSGSASAQSVDPEGWVKSELLVLEDGVYTYDHKVECAIRDAAAKPDERAFARVRATAPQDAISRDQLIALVQRMESVFLMSIGQGFRPDATAMEMASVLDCRPRPGTKARITRELTIDVSETGFVSKFIDHDSGAASRHAETWAEAFRP
ncbi:MAG: hypothetical protein AB8G23_02425 [Myxococcota bacterium]